VLNNVRKITRPKVTDLCKNQLFIASATVVIIHTRLFLGFSRLARGDNSLHDFSCQYNDEIKLDRKSKLKKKTATKDITEFATFFMQAAITQDE